MCWDSILHENKFWHFWEHACLFKAFIPKLFQDIDERSNATLHNPFFSQFQISHRFNPLVQKFGNNNICGIFNSLVSGLAHINLLWLTKRVSAGSSWIDLKHTQIFAATYLRDITAVNIPKAWLWDSKPWSSTLFVSEITTLQFQENSQIWNYLKEVM